MSDRPESLAAALAELQQHLPRIGKDAQAQYGKYADLADVTRALLPLMAELGLAWTCCPTTIGDRFYLHYQMMFVGGDVVEGEYPLPDTTKYSPQQLGSAITYARRYCLLAVTGAAPDEDDDDAQAAEQAARAQRNQPPEVRADGSATEAEQMRMNRGHEPGVERLGTVPVDDGWYDQPAPAEAPEDRPGTSTKSQRQGIYIALGRRGIKDHKSAIERLTGRDIAEPADMSYNEAIMVKARVDSWDGRTEELLSPFVAERSRTGGD